MANLYDTINHTNGVEGERRDTIYFSGIFRLKSFFIRQRWMKTSFVLKVHSLDVRFRYLLAYVMTDIQDTRHGVE